MMIAFLLFAYFNIKFLALFCRNVKINMKKGEKYDFFS